MSCFWASWKHLAGQDMKEDTGLDRNLDLSQQGSYSNLYLGDIYLLVGYIYYLALSQPSAASEMS